MNNRLIKYCPNEYNVALGTTSIQLGTLEYYRALDPKFAIADDGEGTHTILLKEGVEISLTNEVSEHLFGGAVQGNGLTITANQPGAKFVSIVNNLYIFCVSITTPDDPPSRAKAAEIDPSYDSFWEITDRIAFRDVIGYALADTLTLDCLSEHSRKAVESLPIGSLSLQVVMMENPVEYIDSREHKIEKLEDIGRIPKYKDILARSVFRKESRDEQQREHRFVFAVSHPKLGMLSVRPEPKQIPLNRLYNIVTSAGV